MATGVQRESGNDLDNVGTLTPEKLHRTVLNRCKGALMKDLNFEVVMIYIQKEGLLDEVTIRDINNEKRSSYKIRRLIEEIQKRDQYTYVMFKECLIRAQQDYFIKMLDEVERNLAAEMKEKDRGAEASKVKSQMEAGAEKELDESQTTVMNTDCRDTDDVDGPITQEHINFLRLYIALTNVCSNALREILLTNVPTPHKDIYKAILANQANLKKKVYKEQIPLVFPDPQGLSTGKVEEFDITLLCAIIRNVSSVPDPSNDWGKPPADHPRDTTLRANVDRIRLYRNHIVGHNLYGMISQQEFEDYWAKIDEVLRDIEIVIGNHGYQKDLEDIKNQAFTTQEARELRKEFQEYKRKTNAAASDMESSLEEAHSALVTGLQKVEQAISHVKKLPR